MNIGRLASRLALGAAVTALVTAGLGAPAALAHGKSKALGTRSLAAVLTADTSGFDRNGRDFDVLTAAVLAVLNAKPDSAVKVLTDGKVALTAFVPTDAAFQQLAREVTKSRKLPSEKSAFTTVAGLGIDTVEAVLLYHVVPGATIDKRAALQVRQRPPDHRRRFQDQGRRAALAPGHPGRRRPQRPQPGGRQVQHQQGQQADRPRREPRPAPGGPALIHTARPTRPAGLRVPA